METKKYQLPKEFATKWVEALRSGKYSQTEATLCRPDTCEYCCLGVAGAMTGLDNIDMSELSDLSDFVDIFKTKYVFNDGIKQLADNQKLQNVLTNLNDVDKLSFTEIADWIEANVEFI